MAGSFAESYPNIARWVILQGWVELGRDHYSSSMVRVPDEGVAWFVSGRSHIETWAGCIAPLTIPTGSSLKASSSVPELY